MILKRVIVKNINSIKKIIYYSFLGSFIGKFKTVLNLFRFRKKKNRFLEIGPGTKKIPGFETLNIKFYAGIDFMLDASRKLPFRDNTFDVIYASHILEHISWYKIKEVLGEWVRILKKGGVIEIWVPDGLKISQAFINAEFNINDDFKKDGWYRFNPEQDPCIWFSGRTYSYGDGNSNYGDPNWHHSAFSYRFLEKTFMELGLTEVKELNHDNVRGYDHGWINLGISGRKV